MQRAARILFVSHESSLYGAQLSLLGLLDRLDRSRFEPFMVAHHEGPLVKHVRELGIPVIISPISHWIASGADAERSWFDRAKLPVRNLKYNVSALTEVIEKNEIDLVYTNTVVCIEGALAARISNRPHIWHLREQVKGNSQLSAIVPPLLIPWIVGILSSRVLVNSRYLAKAYSNYSLRNKLKVVYNGVDPERFRIDHHDAVSELMAEFNIPKHHKIIATIGAIIPRKGQLRVVEAAAHLALSNPDVTFLFVGQGDADYINLVRSRVLEHGLESHFRFVGWRKDIAGILAGTDLLLVAAEEEPFGRTIIEGMATGVPVVSTKCGGPEEIIVDGITGLLVSSGDSIQMANAIHRVLSDQEFSEQLARAGEERFNLLFTLQAYANCVEEHLETVLAGCKGSRTTDCDCKKTVSR